MKSFSAKASSCSARPARASAIACTSFTSDPATDPATDGGDEAARAETGPPGGDAGDGDAGTDGAVDSSSTVGCSDGTVEGFFFTGLFDEMMQQPSNIFDEVTDARGVSYYVPLTAETWIRCLETLRLILLPSQ